jgi:glycogen phosphorylase
MAKKTEEAAAACEDIRTGLSAKTIAKAFVDNLYYIQGCNLLNAGKNDLYLALSYTIRDRMLAHLNRELHYLESMKNQKDMKIVSYLSAEFLPGPHLGNNLVSMCIYDEVKRAMESLAIDLDELLEQEVEPGLGNGGLGRLASCFMDSLASLDIPAIGYGIRYEFGIFNQEIMNGWQVESTDNWLNNGNPWEIARIGYEQTVKFGGYTKSIVDEAGNFKVEWIPDRIIKGVPYDTPILGYGRTLCNSLRLWKAEAVESFDFFDFNKGDYFSAVNEKIKSETISKVLYPNDETDAGKELRLMQQYFFVSCSLKDMIRIHLRFNSNLDNFYKHFSIQLNDTHPAVAVAELMRLLIDMHGMEWDKAWDITTKAVAYTNHTLLPEALEKWAMPLFSKILPRHMDIIFEINSRFMEKIQVIYPGDYALWSRLSIIDDSGCKYVRMANLACVAAFKINGVAALHSELLRKYVLHDFYQLWPEKFVNVTNGVTPRRWVALSNQKLSALITEKIGDSWIKNYHTEISKLEQFAGDKDFCSRWQQIKLDNKKELAAWIKKNLSIEVDPNSMFDILVKRIHEYKRQHLQVLHIIDLYNKIKDNPDINVPSRTFIFGGKAAPGYFMAKRIIKLITSVGEVVNNDPATAGKLNVVYIPNFSVKKGHMVYPASDLSEQISMAGKEASGTGNMKFSMNGALTIGTLDGANVEIREEVGEENFFLFGLETQEVYEKKAAGYNPKEYYDNDQGLKRVIDQIASGYFSKGDTELFRPIVDNLLYSDPYMLMADFRSYIDCQTRVGEAYLNKDKWTKMSILNVARVGKFSSDRSIRDYARDIWNVESL